MRRKNITQQTLADELGVSRQSVSYYCNGQSSPDWETIAKIARYFGVSSDYLLGLTDVPTPETDIRATADLTGLSQNSVIHLKCWKMDSKYHGHLRILNQLFSDANFFSLIRRIIRYLDVVKKVDPALAVHRETLDFIQKEAGDDLIKEIQLHENMKEKILSEEELKKAEDMRDVEYLRVHRAFSELMTSMGNHYKNPCSTEGSAINGND